MLEKALLVQIVNLVVVTSNCSCSLMFWSFLVSFRLSRRRIWPCVVVHMWLFKPMWIPGQIDPSIFSSLDCFNRLRRNTSHQIFLRIVPGLRLLKSLKLCFAHCHGVMLDKWLVVFHHLMLFYLIILFHFHWKKDLAMLFQNCYLLAKWSRVSNWTPSLRLFKTLHYLIMRTQSHLW